MPSIQDWDPNDENESGFGTDGSSGSSSGGGQLFGGASKQREQAYTPWSRFTSANSDVSQREAGKLQGQVGADVDSAMRGLDNANAALNKGIASNYATTPGSQSTTTDTQRAQGDRTAAAGVGNAFGGSSWASFGTPTATTQQPGGIAVMPNAPPKPAGKGNQPKAAPIGQPNAVSAGATGTGMGGGAELTRGPQVSGAAVANGPQGPKDLESSMTPGAWDALTGKITNADAEATQLGSEGGIQALLSQNGGQPATGFDAALINGAGQKSFGDAAQKFGNGALTGQQVNSQQASQDAWSKLGGDINSRKQVDANKAANAQRDADNARGMFDTTPKAEGGPGSADPAEPSFDDMLRNDKEHQMDAGLSGRRTTTNNASSLATWNLDQGTGGPGKDAYDLATQIMKEAGLTDADAPEGKGSPAQAAYWEQFMSSLPEGMQNYVNGMIANTDLAGGELFGRDGTYGSGDKEGLAARNSDEQWAWFQSLFRAYMKAHPPAKTPNADGSTTQTGGGLTSESTKPPK